MMISLPIAILFLLSIFAIIGAAACLILKVIDEELKQRKITDKGGD